MIILEIIKLRWKVLPIRMKAFLTAVFATSIASALSEIIFLSAGLPSFSWPYGILMFAGFVVLYVAAMEGLHEEEDARRKAELHRAIEEWEP